LAEAVRIGSIRKALRIFTPRQKRTGLWIVALAFIGMILEILGTALVVPVLSLTEHSDWRTQYPALAPWLARAGNPSNERLILWSVIALVVVFVVKTSFLVYYYWEESRFVFGFQAELSQRLFTTYLRQPYPFHLQRNSAILLRNTINEVSNFNVVLSQGTTLITEGLVLTGMSVLLISLEPFGALVVLVMLGGTSFLFHLATRKHLFRWGKARQRHEGMRIKHLQEGLGSIKDVKLLGREEDFLAQYHLHNILSTDAARHHNTLKQLPRLWLEMLIVAGIAALVFSLLANGRTIVSIVPVLGLFGAAAFRLMPSANRLSSAVQSLKYGMPVVHVLYDELALDAPAPRDANRQPAAAFQDAITITDVKFTYAGAARPALNGITLVVKRGECVGLIGPSGSGKSTLVDVLLGLLPNDSGVIAIDGKPIDTILRAWQDQIGYVPQSIYLTDDTLRRNVAFGVPDERIDDGAVRRAISAARLDEFVAAQPDGLNSVVGERGVRISGGQRQRVGIARALYHDPAVLVLDEATSALDAVTETEVMQAVMEMHGSKTILIVAHRLSTVQRCDRLYRIECGRVADQGVPSEMLSAAPRQS
jgi:ABC-type multidrug transport system fused ATPase/permease subunit